MSTPSPSGASTLAVVGGSGGCGASVLSAALATRAALAGRPCVLIDLDVCAGGLDVVLGIEREAGPRWRDLHGLRGSVDVERLIEQLPTTAEGVAVLSHDRTWFEPDAATVASVVQALAEVPGVLILDTSRLIRPVPLRPDALLLLAHGTVSGLAAAQSTCERLILHDQAPMLVTRDVADDLTHRIADILEVPLVGEVRSESSVETDLARGRAPGRNHRSRLSGVCDEILRDVVVDGPRAA